MAASLSLPRHALAQPAKLLPYPLLPDRQFRRTRRHVEVATHNVAKTDAETFLGPAEPAPKRGMQGAVRAALVADIEAFDFRHIEGEVMSVNARELVESLDAKLFEQFQKQVLDRHAEAIAVAMDHFGQEEKRMRGRGVFDEGINIIRLRTQAHVAQASRVGSFNITRIAGTVAEEMLAELESGRLRRSAADGVISRTPVSTMQEVVREVMRQNSIGQPTTARKRHGRMGLPAEQIDSDSEEERELAAQKRKMRLTELGEHLELERCRSMQRASHRQRLRAMRRTRSAVTLRSPTAGGDAARVGTSELRREGDGQHGGGTSNSPTVTDKQLRPLRRASSSSAGRLVDQEWNGGSGDGAVSTFAPVLPWGQSAVDGVGWMDASLTHSSHAGSAALRPLLVEGRSRVTLSAPSGGELVQTRAVRAAAMPATRSPQFVDRSSNSAAVRWAQSPSPSQGALVSYQTDAAFPAPRISFARSLASMHADIALEVDLRLATLPFQGDGGAGEHAAMTSEQMQYCIPSQSEAQQRELFYLTRWVQGVSHASEAKWAPPAELTHAAVHAFGTTAAVAHPDAGTSALQMHLLRASATPACTGSRELHRHANASEAVPALGTHLGSGAIAAAAPAHRPTEHPENPSSQSPQPVTTWSASTSRAAAGSRPAADTTGASRTLSPATTAWGATPRDAHRALEPPGTHLATLQKREHHDGTAAHGDRRRSPPCGGKVSSPWESNGLFSGQRIGVGRPSSPQHLPELRLSSREGVTIPQAQGLGRCTTAALLERAERSKALPVSASAKIQVLGARRGSAGAGRATPTSADAGDMIAGMQRPRLRTTTNTPLFGLDFSLRPLRQPPPLSLPKTGADAAAAWVRTGSSNRHSAKRSPEAQQCSAPGESAAAARGNTEAAGPASSAPRPSTIGSRHGAPISPTGISTPPPPASPTRGGGDSSAGSSGQLGNRGSSLTGQATLADAALGDSGQPVEQPGVVPTRASRSAADAGDHQKPAVLVAEEGRRADQHPPNTPLGSRVAATPAAGAFPVGGSSPAPPTASSHSSAQCLAYVATLLGIWSQLEVPADLRVSLVVRYSEAALAPRLHTAVQLWRKAAQTAIALEAFKVVIASQRDVLQQLAETAGSGLSGGDSARAGGGAPRDHHHHHTHHERHGSGNRSRGIAALANGRAGGQGPTRPNPTGPPLHGSHPAPQRRLRMDSAVRVFTAPLLEFWIAAGAIEEHDLPLLHLVIPAALLVSRAERHASHGSGRPSAAGDSRASRTAGEGGSSETDRGAEQRDTELTPREDDEGGSGQLSARESVGASSPTNGGGPSGGFTPCVAGQAPVSLYAEDMVSLSREEALLETLFFRAVALTLKACSHVTAAFGGAVLLRNLDYAKATHASPFTVLLNLAPLGGRGGGAAGGQGLGGHAGVPGGGSGGGGTR